MKEKIQGAIEMVNGDLKFRAESGHNTPILLDTPDGKGHCEGYSAEQLVLLGLADCAATTVTNILRESGRNVEGLSVKVTGIHHEEEPWGLKKIFLNFTIDSTNASWSDMLKAFSLAENSCCPVWGLLKGNVEVQTQFSLRLPMAV